MKKRIYWNIAFGSGLTITRNTRYNKEKNLYREFFKIEKHPKLEKPWIGSKSNKISILDKLKEANNYIDLLNN